MHPLLLAISLNDQIGLLVEQRPHWLTWEIALVYNNLAVRAIEQSVRCGAPYALCLLGDPCYWNQPNGVVPK